MKVDASLIKQLRAKTGAGMLDCRKALQENNGDIEEAAGWLRQRGSIKAEKKATRATTEGLIAAFINEAGTQASLVEVNCETDFVAKTDQFQALVDGVARHVAEKMPVSLNSEAGEGPYLMEQTYLLDENQTVDEHIKSVIATTGENTRIKRFATFTSEGTETLGKYIHPGSKVGVVLQVDGGSISKEAVGEFLHEMGMQIAAMQPIYIDRSEIDQSILDKEFERYRQGAIDEGIKEHIVDNVAKGKLNSYLKGQCLVDQPYIRDNSLTVAKYIENFGKEHSGEMKLKRFVRFDLTGQK